MVSVLTQKMRNEDSMENLVRASDSDWTLVRPPVLTNGKASGRFRSGIDVQARMTGPLSRDDLVFLILDVVRDGSRVHQPPVVST
ncbi:MAG: NAD(P)H-binding protein [Massilia sp.]